MNGRFFSYRAMIFVVAVLSAAVLSVLSTGAVSAQGFSQIAETGVWFKKIYLHPVDGAAFIEDTDVTVAGKVEVSNNSDKAVHATLSIQVYKWDPTMEVQTEVIINGQVIIQVTHGAWVEVEPDIDDDTDVVSNSLPLDDEYNEVLKVGPETEQYDAGAYKVVMKLTISEVTVEGHAGTTIATAKITHMFHVYKPTEAPPFVTINPNPNGL